jgi:hypothetical protein
MHNAANGSAIEAHETVLPWFEQTTVSMPNTPHFDTPFSGSKRNGTQDSIETRSVSASCVDGNFANRAGHLSSRIATTEAVGKGLMTIAYTTALPSTHRTEICNVGSCYSGTRTYEQKFVQTNA